MNKPEVQEYEQYFNRLNQEQQAAVLETEGPVRVIAGPGTGKTEVLCLRIGRILMVQDCHPSNILCLTFSRAAVQTIQARLQTLIGSTADLVEVHTFHSFCFKLLKEKGPDALRNRKLISRAQQSMLLSRILSNQFSSEDPRQLKPAPAAVISSYLNVFSHLTKESISLAALQDSTDAWSKEVLSFAAQLSDLHAAYISTLEARNLLTFDDLLLETIKILSEQPALHAAIREKYQYLLVDEFQDTNPLQLQLIRLLTAGESSPNLFVVGDENQSIYRFQGAGTAQFLWMEEQFKMLRTKSLSINYRSNPALVAAFDGIAAALPGRLLGNMSQASGTPLSNDSKASISCRIYRNGNDEARGTALFLQQLLKRDKLDSTAVLARKHQELLEVAAYLHQLKIPFRYNRSEQNLLQTHFGQCLSHTLQFLHLRGLDNYMSEGSLFHALLHKKDGKQLLHLFMEQRQQSQVKLFEWIGNSGSKLPYFLEWFPSIQALLWRIDETLTEETINLLKTAVLAGLRQQPTENEEQAWREWLNQFLETDKQKSLRSLAAMINYQVQQHIPITTFFSQDNQAEDILTLSTIHAAKGMGFKRVLLIGCQANNWETAPPPGVLPIPVALRTLICPDPVDDDDLTRLLYVACTRARQELHLSYHEADSGSGLSQLLGPVFNQEITIEDYRDEEFNIPNPTLYRVEGDEAWNNLVQERCARYALSPTGTHSWQECQNRFFITQLVKVPGLGSEATAFGNVIHEVLKLTGKAPSRQYDPVWLEQTINRLFKSYWFRFHPVHLDAYRRYALWLLPGYLKSNPIPDQPTSIEKSFQFVSPEGMRIKGILDRVDYKDGVVRMTDYKTGRRRDSLEPFVDADNPGSAYWRQGMIYAAIMQAVYPEVREFQFSFHYLEADTPEEVLDVIPHEGLNKWLQTTWEEIMALRLRTSCSDPDCIYCEAMRSFTVFSS